MNIETASIGTFLIAVGLYDTYLATPETEIPYVGWIGEIFMLSGGALLVGRARDDEDILEATENVARNMVFIRGMK